MRARVGIFLVGLLTVPVFGAPVSFDDLFHPCVNEESPAEQCIANTLGSFTTPSSASGYYVIGLELKTGTNVAIDCCVHVLSANLVANTRYCMNTFAGSFFSTQIGAQSGTEVDFNNSTNNFKISDEIGESSQSSSSATVVCSNFGAGSPSCTFASGPVNLGVIGSGGDSSTACSIIASLAAGSCQYSGECALAQPCENGGICTDVSPNSYSCACVGDFSGAICDESAANCAPDSDAPCLNGGTCVPDPTGGACSCADCFTGAQCDEYTCA